MMLDRWLREESPQDYWEKGQAALQGICMKGQAVGGYTTGMTPLYVTWKDSAVVTDPGFHASYGALDPYHAASVSSEKLRISVANKYPNPAYSYVMG